MEIDPDDEPLQWFPNKEKAIDAANRLLKVAEDMVGDLEGRYPLWVDDTCVLEVRKQVRRGFDSLFLDDPA